MNELLCVIRTVVGTLSTVRAIDYVKKSIVAVSALVCGFYVIRLWKK